MSTNLLPAQDSIPNYDISPLTISCTELVWGHQINLQLICTCCCSMMMLQLVEMIQRRLRMDLNYTGIVDQ